MNLQDGSWKKHGQVHTTELKKIESKEVIIMMNYFCAMLSDESTLNLPNRHLPAKVNNRNTRPMCETWSKLAIKTSERRQWHRFGVFIVNAEHILHLILVFLLLTLSR